MEQQPPGRRRFLKSLTALGAAGVPVAVVAKGAETRHTRHPRVAQAQGGTATRTAQAPQIAQARVFLTQEEFDFLEAASARLIPADELGPGGKEAGVAYFIDGQLNGYWGTMGRQYRQGPWPAATPQQGYQLQFTPQELYRLGISDVNAYCQKQYGKTFARLDAAQQDEVLHGLDEGKIALNQVPPRTFFNTLLNNTMEGFFSDPIHGGNRDKVGWKLVGFPGVAAVYTKYITQYNTPYRVEPVSILDVEQRTAKVDEHGHPKHVMLTSKD